MEGKDLLIIDITYVYMQELNTFVPCGGKKPSA